MSENGPYEHRIALLEKALRHYRFGPRGWAARMGLAGGDVGIDPQTADESAGGPFEWERVLTPDELRAAIERKATGDA